MRYLDAAEVAAVAHDAVCRAHQITARTITMVEWKHTPTADRESGASAVGRLLRSIEERHAPLYIPFVWRELWMAVARAAIQVELGPEQADTERVA